MFFDFSEALGRLPETPAGPRLVAATAWLSIADAPDTVVRDFKDTVFTFLQII